eukprot:GHVP01063104.1.p1 GENE.GHVP01063104.1~~GHVP01063104.1.p1  ORF type:complete len:175 (+),score=29.38 GHVP01063104.1:30-527(+)
MSSIAYNLSPEKEPSFEVPVGHFAFDIKKFPLPHKDAEFFKNVPNITSPTFIQDCQKEQDRIARGEAPRLPEKISLADYMKTPRGEFEASEVISRAISPTTQKADYRSIPVTPMSRARRLPVNADFADDSPKKTSNARCSTFNATPATPYRSQPKPRSALTFNEF